MQDTNTKSSRGTRHPGLAIFQETAVQQLIKPLGQDLHSQVSLESWQKTKFLLMGSSRGKDEHTAEEMKAHLQQAAPVMGCFACRSWDACPTRNWFSVWSGLTLLPWTRMEAVSGLGRGVQGSAGFLTETPVCCSILCAVTTTNSFLLFLSTVH